MYFTLVKCKVHQKKNELEKESWFSKLSIADISTNKANQLKTVLEPKDEELKEGL